MLESCRKNLTFVILTVVLFLTDQVSKEMATLILKSEDSHPLVDTFFNFVFIKNRGLIFGFFSSSRYFSISFNIFLLGALIVFWLFYLKRRIFIFFSFILAGLSGNLWDRIFRGGVVDFIDLKFWPVFNLADCYILIGIILLALFMVKRDKQCIL